MGLTHAQLTEPSVSDPVVTHDRKGREGKGRELEGMGGRVETSHHVVQIGDEVAARLGMMTAPLNDTTTGLATIEGVDLDAEVPCEDPNRDHAHAHAAELLVRFRCTNCPRDRVRALCRKSWTDYAAGFLCFDCFTAQSRDEVCTIVEVLR